LTFGLIGATHAVAGVADSPLPMLMTGARHLYSVLGVVSDEPRCCAACWPAPRFSSDA